MQTSTSTGQPAKGHRERLLDRVLAVSVQLCVASAITDSLQAVSNNHAKQMAASSLCCALCCPSVCSCSAAVKKALGVDENAQWQECNMLVNANFYGKCGVSACCRCDKCAFLLPLRHVHDSDCADSACLPVLTLEDALAKAAHLKDVCVCSGDFMRDFSTKLVPLLEDNIRVMIYAGALTRGGVAGCQLLGSA
jgi:hypothetical protein